MPTASYLIADMQTKLGDPSGNIFTSARLLQWLDEAQKTFCLKTMPLRRIDATTIATGLYKFPIPSDNIMIEGLFSRKQIGTKMARISGGEWHNQVAACPGARGYDSDNWTEMDGQIYAHPAYGTSPATALLGSTISATVRTIPVNSTAKFHGWGRILIESEEIEYASIDATNFYGCTRGVGGTTAAIHAPPSGSSLTVQQCDLWIVYRYYASLLGTVTATPEIPYAFQEGLELYCMYLAYKQEGSEERSQAVWKLWEEHCLRADYFVTREHLSLIGIGDMETTKMKTLYGVR